ncbi:MAG: hypothetical protein ABL891_10555, partial [Burkholderiales bacterium]
EEEAARKRKEEQGLREAKLAEETSERKFQQELVVREQQRAQATERQRAQKPAPNKESDLEVTERQFEEELAFWEKIVESREAVLFENYLLRYPSGRFSEVAQLRLDQVLAQKGEKRIEVVSDAKNPFTKGSARANTRYKIGDSYTYRSLDLTTQLVERTFTTTIVKITDTEVIYDRGLVTNLLGNRLRAPDGRRFTDSQAMPLEFAVGKRWSSRFNVMLPDGEPWSGRKYRIGGDAGGETKGGTERQRGSKGGGARGQGSKAGVRGASPGFGTIDMDFRIVAREQITVLAGTFDTFHVQAKGWSTGATGASKFPIRIETNTWHAPAQCRRAIAMEVRRQAGPNNLQSSRDELVAFSES